MLFYLRNRNKTVKVLRKNAGFTVKELALKVKLDPAVISRVDNKKLKEIPEKLKNRLIPIFRGDYQDNIPW